MSQSKPRGAAAFRRTTRQHRRSDYDCATSGCISRMFGGPLRLGKSHGRISRRPVEEVGARRCGAMGHATIRALAWDALGLLAGPSWRNDAFAQGGHTRIQKARNFRAVSYIRGKSRSPDRYQRAGPACGWARAGGRRGRGVGWGVRCGGGGGASRGARDVTCVVIQVRDLARTASVSIDISRQP